jgi:threonine synthase
VELVNSVNPARIEGQKTAAFEIVDQLGRAPDIHCLPVGNAGNITAYWKGYVEYAGRRRRIVRPRMWGFQAAGAAPLVSGEPVLHPETIATAIRIGNPASWASGDRCPRLVRAHRFRDRRGDPRRLLPAGPRRGLFCEPASAASVAGLLKLHAAGALDPGQVVVCTVTGHGLKDPQWALKTADGSEVTPVRVPVDAYSVARALGLEG